ncbi:MAG: hypothetical protein AB9897_04805 [Anaerolineaceae bacterium]
MQKVKAFVQKWQAVLLIILVSILAYGLLIPRLGLYMDDWTFTWTYMLYGSKGLFAYFSLNRPFWGFTYQLTMPLLQDNILAWHIFGLVCRIIVSLAFYWLLCLIWPKQKNLTLSAGLLFAVYPGFLLQVIALCFGHMWLVLASLLFSCGFTILAIRNPSRRVLYTVIAVVLSLYNMLSMEYFLTLEPLRWLLVFFIIVEPLPFWKRVVRSVKWLVPYLFALLGVGIYRGFFYKGQTVRYAMQLLEVLKQDFGSGLVLLGKEMISALYQTTLLAWVQPFKALISQFNTSRVYLGILALLIVVFGGLLFVILRGLKDRQLGERSHRDTSPLWMALFALLLAGIPFYITLLPVEVSAINSRFTMPFIFGAALLLAFLLELIPVRWLKAGLLSLLIAGSIGLHLLNANDFRLMSIENNELMYEMWWRAPSLKPGTLVITNERTSSLYYTPSTLRTELNLIYPHDADTSFGWEFATDLIPLVGSPVKPHTGVVIPMFTTDFKGSTDSAVVFQISDTGCARFVDSQSTFFVKEIVDNDIQKISNKENLVSSPGQSVQLDVNLIGPEPEHRWCYYFEKSDLALQMEDFTAIQQNYQVVVEKGYQPVNDYEWFPFIEGLARGGDWQDAIALSQRVIEENPTNESYQPFICQIIYQIATKPNSGNQPLLAMKDLNCSQ